MGLIEFYLWEKKNRKSLTRWGGHILKLQVDVGHNTMSTSFMLHTISGRCTKSFPFVAVILVSCDAQVKWVKERRYTFVFGLAFTCSAKKDKRKNELTPSEEFEQLDGCIAQGKIPKPAHNFFLWFL